MGNPFIEKAAPQDRIFGGVLLGDKIRITWEHDTRYALESVGTFTGIVHRLDRWLRLHDGKSYWSYPRYMVRSVEIVEKQVLNALDLALIGRRGPSEPPPERLKNNPFAKV